MIPTMTYRRLPPPASRAALSRRPLPAEATRSSICEWEGEGGSLAKFPMHKREGKRP